MQEETFATAPNPVPALPDFGAILGTASPAPERTSVRWREFTLHSHLQPIVSFSHRAVVGHEGLVRAQDAQGRPIAPPDLLLQADRPDALIGLDRACRFVHLSHVARLGVDGYVFLNMHPIAFSRLEETRSGAFMRELIAHCGLTPDRIVIEITEDAVANESAFEFGVHYLRGLGFRIALDDFGAGHSNFDRVWRLRPEFVKLDRDFAVRAERDEEARRLLPQIIELLHEAGSLVLLEGIENAEQARIAMDADADFAQGYFFGRPAPEAAVVDDVVAAVDATWALYDAARAGDKQRYRDRTDAYMNAIGFGASLLADRRPIDDAVALFLSLPKAMRCYQLDEDGFQISRNIAPAGESLAPGFRPDADAARSRWSRRPYFRRAMDAPGRVCISRPYLCISSAILCVTMSIGYQLDGKRYVLCGDLAWN